MYSKYLVPLIYIATLIKNNPCNFFILTLIKKSCFYKHCVSIMKLKYNFVEITLKIYIIKSVYLTYPVSLPIMFVAEIWCNIILDICFSLNILFSNQ